MLVKLYSGAVQGIDASIVTVEVASATFQKDIIVGLPDSAVRESVMRTGTALKNSGFKNNQRTMINLSPADVRKEGTAYDLPLGIGRLVVSEQLRTDRLDNYIINGELSLDGTLQPIKGALNIALEAKEKGYQGVLFPKENAQECVIVEGIEVYGFEHFSEVVQFLQGNDSILPLENKGYADLVNDVLSDSKDFSDVKGQLNVKRAMEIAAAGGHNVVLIGPPGAGKTMLAKRLPSILPKLDLEEALETTKIHSVTSKSQKVEGLVTQRPFRSPHHTISDVALVGGGVNPSPGEISMAHNGVLFLDELTEFKRSVLEVMRQPLEERVISINRARFSVDYPASFMLVASMNPCACGYYNHPTKECVCPPGGVKKYLNKISGPLLDRIDLHVEVIPVSFNELSAKSESERSSVIQERVIKARLIQSHRFQDSKTHNNSEMSSKEIRTFCDLNDACQNLLQKAMEKLGLSARAYDRIKKVARTIADLEESEEIKTYHISEAISYRSLDRRDWGEN